MFRWPWKGESERSAHLRDEELLLFVDGELSARRSVRVRNQLESCWACRARRQQMEAAITRYVEADRSVVDAAPPPKRWREFEARLEESVARDAGEPLAAPSAGIRFGWRVILAAAVILGCLTAATLVVSSRLNPSAAPASPAARPKSATPNPRTPAAAAGTGTPVAPRPDRSSGDAAPENLTTRAIEIEYALHQIHACLGGEVRVLRQNGKLHLSGVVASAPRRDQVMAALAGAMKGAAVVNEVRLSDSRAGNLRTPSTAGGTLRSDDSEKIETVVIPLEIPLREYSRKHPEFGEPSAAISRWSGEAVTSSAAAAREAWVIRWLADQYGGAALGAEARQRVGAMVRDHAIELRQNLARVRGIVAPLFEDVPAAPLPADPPTGWANLAIAILEKAEACERIIGILFTGEGSLNLPPVAPRTGTRPAVPPAEELARQFLSTEDWIDRECVLLERSLAGDGRPESSPRV